MHIRNRKWYRLLSIVCAGMLITVGCGKVKTEERMAAPVQATPTSIPEYRPKSAADLAQKTAEKLEDLRSVHMELTSVVEAKLDLLGTILGGLGNKGDGKSFIPDLDSILGTGTSSAYGDTGNHRKMRTKATGKYEAGPVPAGSTAAFTYMSAGEADVKDFAFSMKLKYEADIQGDPSGMYFRGAADVNILGDSKQIPTEVYYFEEGRENAVYSKKGDTWERQTVEMENISPSVSSEFFKRIADGTVSAGLSDMSVDVNGHETYRMNITVSGDNINSILPQMMGPLQNAVENNDTLHSLFGATSQIEDVSDISVQIRVYIDKETFYPVQMKIDMAELGQELFNSMSSVKVEVDTFDTVIDYSLFNDTTAGEPPV